jgi:hypothetical protein
MNVRSLLPIDQTSLSKATGFLILICVFLAHAFSFGTWIIDDAAISFAYARNLALGHGLVPQVGSAPVEGYSNPLWVFLLAPFFRIGFDPVLTPKITAVLLVIVAFYIVCATFEFKRSIFLALAALSLNTSFVVWCISGLENPLLVFDAAVLVWALVRGRFALLGAAVAMLALTRPDGAGYLLVIPLVAWLNRWSFRDVLRSFIVFAVPYGAFLLARRLIFDAWLPNTAVVKGTLLLYQLTLPSLIFSVGGSVGGWLLLILMPTFLIIGARHHKVNADLHCLLACLLVSMLLFSVLPSDWMGEYRFATLFFLFLYPLIALILEVSVPRVAPVLLVGVIVMNLLLFLPRTAAFRANPSVPTETIMRLSDTLMDYARALHVTNPSLLGPDAGGILYRNALTFIDLGGLTDATIARALYSIPGNPNWTAFYDYLLKNRRPTFVEMHDGWTIVANLRGEPEFERDYVEVMECAPTAQAQADLPDGGWLYVRRDVFSGIYPDANLVLALEQATNKVCEAL